MTFIQSFGTYNSIPDNTQPDLTDALKKLCGKVYRRTDHFIQLAIIGAHKAVHGACLPEQTAIYMTSGQGNISIFERICVQRRQQNMLPRPVDFINLLGNSAGFYVASHLGIQGKNIFVTHHRFPVQMMMIAARNDLCLKKQETILIGGVDEWVPQQERAKKLLGLSPEHSLGEGSNWMLLSNESKHAQGCLEVHPQIINATQLHNILVSADVGTSLSFSFFFPDNEAKKIMKMHPHCRRYYYEDYCGYYETMSMFALIHFLSREKGRLIHIDGNENHSMIMSVTNDDL